MILPRQYGYGYGYGSSYSYNSPWYLYGRWILLAVLIVVAITIFAVMACIRSRRRVRAGGKPLPMTAWMVPNQQYPQANGQQQGYYGGYPQQQPPYAAAGGTGGYNYAGAQSYSMSDHPRDAHTTGAAPGTGDYVDYSQQQPSYAPPPTAPPTSYQYAPPSEPPPGHTKGSGWK